MIGHIFSLYIEHHKLSNKILIFNLPAITTCINTDMCRNTCYAIRSEKRYEAVRKSRTSNYQASIRNHFVNRMLAIIDKAITKYAIKAVRVHESGDFYSAKYAMKWANIARNIHKEHPEIVFYAYTKSPYRPPSDFNILESILPNGELNYGDRNYIMKLAKKYHATICPYGLTKMKIKCGEECSACLTKKYILFLKH